MKKVLFLDRDGTIIIEPADFQIDSLEKLAFLPHAISSVKKLQDFGYELVMVSNQDGLGTAAYPQASFEAVQEKLLAILESEGIVFSEIFIDPSTEAENSPNRKPRTGMLTQYLAKNSIDLNHSFVIGDRATDIELAKNLGCNSIFIGATSTADFSSTSWLAITKYLTEKTDRKVTLNRKTNETDIAITLNLDGTGTYAIQTGLHFYNHMLEQLVKHSGIDLTLKATGDLHIDEHHTIEDTAIALGMAFKQALGNKKGIERYGFLLPMDDVLVQCAIDFSDRNYCIFKGEFDREHVGDFPTEMLSHWFQSFAQHAGLNINISILEGDNTHHKVEASFKALAKCIKQAIAITGDSLPSTKGVL